MKRSTIYSIFVLCLSFIAAQGAFATTLIIRPPEDVFREAPLIVEGRVLDVVFHAIPNSSMGHADITLSVIEVLKGSCPSLITLRRYGVDQGNGYLFKDYTPSY